MLVTTERRGTIDFPEECAHFIYVRDGGDGWNYCIGHSGDGNADEIASRTNKKVTHGVDTFLGLGRVPYNGEWRLGCSDIFMVVRRLQGRARPRR